MTRRTPTDERRFAEFDAAHPEVWEMFENLAFFRMRQGFDRYSSDAILHQIRWEVASPIDDGTGYRINNDYSSFFARKFREMHPEHARFFEMRSAKVDRQKDVAA